MNANQLRIACVVIASMAGGIALAEDGVTDKTIVFGQVAALSGPAQDLGQGMRQGILAAFEDANRGGGVSGRTLALKSRDDGYEPEKTVEATKASLDDDKVFALIGAVGTPTSKAGQPIATAAKVPFIGPFTGAEFLRNPYNRYVVNVRSSYFEETEAWIEHLTKDLGISKIAILYQDDAFGLAGLDGVQRAMDEAQHDARRIRLVQAQHGRGEVGAARYHEGAEPRSGGDGRRRTSRSRNSSSSRTRCSSTRCSSPSPSSASDSLAKELGKDGAGVIVSQVVPSRGTSRCRWWRPINCAHRRRRDGQAGLRLARRLSGRPPRGRGAQAHQGRADARGAARCDQELRRSTWAASR